MLPIRHRAGLDRTAVVRAAAALVNAEGPEALTINHLARQLGVQPPSIYNHVEGLPGLKRELALLSTRLLGDRIMEAALGKSGAEGIRAVAQAYRSYILENPGLYMSTLRASGNQATPDPELQVAEDRVVRAVLALVVSFGLQGEEAVHAVRALRSVIHGFTTLEAAGGFGLPLDLDESFQRLVDLLIWGMKNRDGGKGQRN